MRSPRRLLALWRLANEYNVPLFQPGCTESLKALPGWDSLLADAPDSAAAIVDAIRALDLLHRENLRSAHTVNIVATLPGTGTDVARTRDSVIDLVRNAEKQILILGFGLTDTHLREELIKASARGVTVKVIGERSRDDLLAFARSWPAVVPAAGFLHLVEPPPGQSALMHAKVVVTDRRRAVIGSANFSSGGFDNNMEIGVVVEGPVAERVCTVVEHLESSRWLEPVPL